MNARNRHQMTHFYCFCVKYHIKVLATAFKYTLCIFFKYTFTPKNFYLLQIQIKEKNPSSEKIQNLIICISISSYVALRNGWNRYKLVIFINKVEFPFQKTSRNSASYLYKQITAP